MLTLDQYAELQHRAMSHPILAERIVATETAAHAMRTERNRALGLPEPPSYDTLIEAMSRVVERLDDASGIVDPGDDELFAYQRELRDARVNMALASGSVSDFENERK